MPAKRFFFFILLITTNTWSCKPKEVVVSPTPPATVTFAAQPKNIVLMIGDGMGLSQISAGIYSRDTKLNMERFSVIGLQKTYSANNLITDSAASATAMACGKKTYNSAIGLDTDTIPCKTILEEAEERGLATGLVVTSTINHATPAAFIAHQKLRIMYEEIATDFLKTDIDFFVGGGRKYFDEREYDKRNLVKELRNKGYHISDYSPKNLSSLTSKKENKFGFFTSENKPPPFSQGRRYLPYASQTAVQFLEQKSDKGFFLMIEGSQIDWAGHANQGYFMLDELLDFDDAVGKVLQFADKNGETLVIVTADHECGGFAINPKSKRKRLRFAFTTNNHTGTMVPVFAYGPKAELFRGIYENTEIYFKMMEAFGFQ